MSFNKFTTFKVDKDDVEVLDGSLIKTAAMKLPEGFTYDPEYLYLKVKAVSAGEYWGDNKNNDYFPEAELLQGYKTFLSAHTFKNHENKKIENAIGDVLTSDWSDKMKCVYLIIRIDKRIAPSIVRGYEKGFMTDVSMGCRVDHVICSYCNQKAKTRFDYCDHLKTMKGKVMDNGKKVCEINIAPKFHDISAVLNGAERTAKVEGLYIHGDKVAFQEEESLEKTASFKETFANMDMFKSSTESKEELNMEVIASSMEKKKEATKDDIKGAKDKIQNKVMATSLDEVAKKNLSNLEKIVDSIKFKYTKHWDRSICIGLGRSIRDIAKSNGVTPEKTFAQFLKVLDIAAINISPLELHDIFFEAMNVDSHDMREMSIKCGDKCIGATDRISNAMKISDVPSTIRIVKSLRDICDNDGYGMLSNNPAPRIRAVIMKSAPSSFTEDESLTGEIMGKIVRGLLESRSNHRSFLIPRLTKIASGDKLEEADNSIHFAPMLMSSMDKVAEAQEMVIPAIMSSVLYSAYQNERAERLASGETDKGIEKMACLMNNDIGFEKKAGKNLVNPIGAISTGIPLMFSYSALQRSRVNNGEEISSLNRYIAENPKNAAFLASFLTAVGSKKINKHGPGIINTVSEVGKKIIKKANEGYDFFNDELVDNAMKDKGYSDKSLIAIKYASALSNVGIEDGAEELLANNSLDYIDMEEYLKTATSCFTIEIEKNASSILNTVGKSVLGDVVMVNTHKGSVAASLPGYIADGLILAGIGKGLSNIAKKNKKGEMTNG